MTVLLVEECKDAAHKDAAANAQPGAPAVHFTVEAGAGGAGAAGAKGGNKIGDAKSPAKKVANITPITDMKKLDEHFSTRSYFEGGAKPTVGDVAQFQATPLNLDQT